MKENTVLNTRKITYIIRLNPCIQFRTIWMIDLELEFGKVLQNPGGNKTFSFCTFIAVLFHYPHL